MTTLFENSAETTTNARSIAGTAQLTAIATEIANKVLATVQADADYFKAQVEASKDDHDAMDALIEDLGQLKFVDITFLKETQEELLDGMLKSQQSKRSRTKGKAKTLENYRTLMTAAIAEALIRLAADKPKQASSRVAGKVSYTAAELEELTLDQDKLRKALRNVQSKKSIMKSKEGFDEADARWLELLAAESTLKGLRQDTITIRVDETKVAVAELLSASAPIDELKLKEAKELLHKISMLVAMDFAEDTLAADEETVVTDEDLHNEAI